MDRRLLGAGPLRSPGSAPGAWSAAGEGLVLAGLGLMSARSAALGAACARGPGVGRGRRGIGLAYAPLSVTALDRAAPGEEGQVTSGLQLCDVLGQALGTGVAGAIVAVAAGALDHRAGIALAFAAAFAVGVVALAVGARLPARLTGSEREPSAARPG